MKRENRNVSATMDCERHLHIFEDDEALKKQTNKVRSRSMRHISRTHRVDLDWLHDRIHLNPMIQIKDVSTTLHKKVHSPETDGHHDARHIYSKQFVSLICYCESFGFQHEQTCQRNFRCICKRETKACSLHRNNCGDCLHGPSRSTSTRLFSITATGASSNSD